MDDVWDEDAVHEPTELKKVEREHGNAGYLSGITKSKEQAHQPGFDEGYAEGASIGIAVGHIIGAFQAMGLHEMEQAALKELSAPELFTSQYYDQNARPLFEGLEHPLIVKWRNRLEQFS